jgi:hypothetical protein
MLPMNLASPDLTMSDLAIFEPLKSLEELEASMPLTPYDPQTANHTPPTAGYFVEKIAQVEIKIYPNPATEKITLEFSGGVETWRAASLRLYSLSGQLLQEQPVHSSTTIVSLAGFAKGTYILKVQVNGHTEDWKIIKN